MGWKIAPRYPDMDILLDLLHFEDHACGCGDCMSDHLRWGVKTRSPHDDRAWMMYRSPSTRREFVYRGSSLSVVARLVLQNHFKDRLPVTDDEELVAA